MERPIKLSALQHQCSAKATQKRELGANTKQESPTAIATNTPNKAAPTTQPTQGNQPLALPPVAQEQNQANIAKEK